MRRLAGQLLLVLLCMGASSRSGAQAKVADELLCDSVLRAARTDSVPVTARAYLIRSDGGLLAPRARALLLETILAHFVAPKPFQLPVFGAGPARLRMLRAESLGDSLTIREPIVYGVYTFTLMRTGAIAKTRATIPSLVPAFDDRVIAAIVTSAADSTPALLPRALDLDEVQLDLRITTGPEDSRFRVPPATVFTAYFPRVRIVDAKPGATNPLPEFPEEERDEGRDGEVLLRVVIDQKGAPLIPTLEVIRATSPAFGLAAARTLARYHFTPAHVDGCGVPQVLELPFWFSQRP